MRSGDWKLVVHKASDGNERRAELFDLLNDPYEQHDRAAAGHDTVIRLSESLDREANRHDDAVPSRSPEDARSVL